MDYYSYLFFIVLNFLVTYRDTAFFPLSLVAQCAFINGITHYVCKGYVTQAYINN